MSRAGRGPDLTGLWMVPYADLMSTMVILFLALFAYAYQERTPEYDRAISHLQRELDAGSAPAKVKADEADLAVRVKQEMDRLALRDFGVRVSASRIDLVLPEPVLFAPGSAELSPAAGPVLDSLARLLADIPNPVLVAGHTDDRPVRSSRLRNNFELSAARAYAVAEVFIRKGLPPERFSVRGYGEHRPAASNDSPEGRARNRRIELSLVRELRRDD